MAAYNSFLIRKRLCLSPEGQIHFSWPFYSQYQILWQAQKKMLGWLVRREDCLFLPNCMFLALTPAVTSHLSQDSPASCAVHLLFRVPLAWPLLSISSLLISSHWVQQGIASWALPATLWTVLPHSASSADAHTLNVSYYDVYWVAAEREQIELPGVCALTQAQCHQWINTKRSLKWNKRDNFRTTVACITCIYWT